jgi:hypothetical protein
MAVAAARLTIWPMVIGERFAWGHLQKTAGDATLGLFRLFPGLILYSDPSNVEDKHASFASRASEVEGKLLAANFRRLPDWTLSWAQHRARHTTGPDGQPVAMNSPHQMVRVARADSRLFILTDNGRFQIDRWIRMERLVDDFIAFISELTELSDEDRDKIATSGPVNALEYDHEIGHWFTPEQVRQLYARNPLWAATEERVYGDLALLD